MSKKRPTGVIYSTNPDYQYQYDEPEVVDTLEPCRQKLRVSLDRHHRGGKTVTLITGFVGTDDDLQSLCKTLKNKCGVGGSAKEGQIIIQGEQADKVIALLLEAGYQAKR